MFTALHDRRNEIVAAFGEFGIAASTCRHLPPAASPLNTNGSDWTVALQNLEAAVRHIESLSAPIYDQEPVCDDIWNQPRMLLQEYESYANNPSVPRPSNIDRIDTDIQNLIKRQIQAMTMYAADPKTGGDPRRRGVHLFRSRGSIESRLITVNQKTVKLIAGPQTGP